MAQECIYHFMMNVYLVGTCTQMLLISYRYQKDYRKEERTSMSQYNPDPTPGPGYNPTPGPGYNPAPGSGSTEEIQVQGMDLADKVKELIHEGNVRHIRIRQGDQTIIEIPLSVGVVGTLLAPWLAAVGAIGALVAQCTIEVVRSDQS
jgi:hypothetical protein